jgi:hypothetical protein
MGYRRGFSAVQELIDKPAGGGDFTNTYGHPIELLWGLTWKDGEAKTVRFLTDDLIVIPMYDFVPCLDGKRREFVDTSALEGPLKRPDWISANLKDDKGKPLRAREFTVGIVVEREKNSDGEWQDKVHEFDMLSDPDDPTSEVIKVELPRFWVLKQGRRFWDQVNSYYSEYGTIVDRNYKIKRSGEGTKSNYTVMAMNTDPDDINDAEGLADLYQIPVIEGYEDSPVTGHIVQWIERRGTEKYFQHLTGKPASEDAPAKSAPAPRGVGLGARPRTTAASDTEPAGSSSSLKERLAKFAPPASK